MTGPSAKTLSRGPRNAGFTLVEIMAVVLVIAIMAAMIAPRLGAFDGAQLKSSSRNLVGTIRLTYSTAVMNKNTYRMVFDLTDHVYWIEERQGKKFVQTQHGMLAERVLPDNIYIRRVRVMDRECVENCREFLYFTPGGYVEEAAIQFGVVDDDRVITVFTRPMTGKAVIALGDVTREEWEQSEGERY